MLLASRLLDGPASVRLSHFSKRQRDAGDGLERALPGLAPPPPAIDEPNADLLPVMKKLAAAVAQRPEGAASKDLTGLCDISPDDKRRMSERFGGVRGSSGLRQCIQHFSVGSLESSAELFLRPDSLNGRVYTAGSAAAAKFLASIDASAEDDSLSVVAASFETAHVRCADATVPLDAITRHAADIEALIAAAADPLPSSADEKWVSSVTYQYAYQAQVIRLSLLLQRARQMQTLHRDDGELLLCSWLLRLTTNERRLLLLAGGQIEQVNLSGRASPPQGAVCALARYARRGVQKGQRAEAEGMDSNGAKAVHAEHAAAIAGREGGGPRGEAERAECNHLYLELRHFEPPVSVIANIAGKLGLPAGFVERLVTAHLQKSALLAPRSPRMGACVYGAAGRGRLQRGCSDEVGTYAEKSRSTLGGTEIGEGWGRYARSVEEWKKRRDTALAAGQGFDELEPTYDALLGMVHMDEDGKPNGTYALFGEGLTGLPSDVSMSASNSLYDFYDKFYDNIGRDDMPFCSTSSPPLRPGAGHAGARVQSKRRQIIGALACLGGGEHNKHHGGRISKVHPLKHPCRAWCMSSHPLSYIGV